MLIAYQSPVSIKEVVSDKHTSVLQSEIFHNLYPACLTNNRVGWKKLSVTNTPAYLIIKSFKVTPKPFLQIMNSVVKGDGDKHTNLLPN